ncbi:MAG: hypothetical protein WBV55_13930, partial [Candidatus Sulfotelmatobacter sp.]
MAAEFENGKIVPIYPKLLAANGERPPDNRERGTSRRRWVQKENRIGSDLTCSEARVMARTGNYPVLLVGITSHYVPAIVHFRPPA